jgi:hypothetical protein
VFQNATLVMAVLNSQNALGTKHVRIADEVGYAACSRQMLALAGAARIFCRRSSTPPRSASLKKVKVYNQRSVVAELPQASAVAHTRCFKMKRDARGS